LTGAALVVLACAAFYAATSQTPAVQPVAAAQAQPAVTNASGLMTFPNVRIEHAPAPSAEPVAAAGQRAFIDPVTKQLREPTAEEVAALETAERARSLRLAASPTVLVQNPNGSSTVILGDQYMVYTVATADGAGHVAVDHATGPEEAAAKVNAKPSAKAGKGARNDR
jgi:hypothetical protein